MSAPFHTPSFGDEVFDLTEAGNFVQQQQTQQQSKRMRSMDSSFEEYHSANDESFANISQLIGPSPTIAATPALARNKQITTADPNEPTKPLSAYALFFRDTVSAIKQQNPNCSFQELSRIVASMWESLDQTHKNVYNKKNEIARNEYLKEMRLYRQRLEEQQDAPEAGDLTNNSSMMQSKPAVFTIPRDNSTTDVNNFTVPHYQQPQQFDAATSQPQQSYGYVPPPVAMTSNNNNNSSLEIATPNATASINDNDSTAPQIQMIAEAGSVQKCERDNCNKRAIISPDWEDEYCSNECVVKHCHTVFSSWVQSNFDARKQ